MKMEQRTVLDYIREWLMPIVVAAFGWYMSYMIAEMRADVKTLLDSKAHQIEQLRALERAVFGKVSEPEDQAFNDKIKRDFYSIIFDKNKVLKYENETFIYI